MFKWKTICIQGNGLHFSPKDYSAYIYSILIHFAVLAILFSINSTIKTFPEKKRVKTISAKLFYNKSSTMVVNDHKAKALIQNTEEVIQNTEEVIQNTEKIIQNTEEVISNTANGSKAKKTIRPVDTSKIKKTAKAVGRVKTPKTTKTTKTTTPVLPQKVLSSSKILQSLREKIDKESYQQQSKEAYERFVKSKNTMPRSSTNFKQLPEAKAVEVNVNCNNVLNKSMMAMSGLLGGTIKCNSFNGSQKYINKRLDKLGIKDKKSD